MQNALLFVKIIEVADEEEIESIAMASNSQNQIDSYQLLSNKEFFKNLEDMFNSNQNMNIYYKRRVGEKDKSDYINVDLPYILRALMSTLFQIPHRASGYFDVTMNKYLESLNKLDRDSYCKLFFICTCLFAKIEFRLGQNKKPGDKKHLLKHHIAYVVFEIISLDKNFKKPKKIGDMPIINNEYVEVFYDILFKLLNEENQFNHIID